MILKIVLKYKLLEWAIDTFVSKIFYSFDILKSESNELKVGQKIKELYYYGTIFYQVTVIGSSFLENKSGGYHFVYKYVKYNNSVTIQCQEHGFITSYEEEDFYNTYQDHELDDIELYIPVKDLEKSNYSTY